jgi:fibronectin-binding autotransporter adhesin
MHSATDPTMPAVCAATAGTVTVDNSSNRQNPVTTSGLRFLTTGYTITGDPLTLARSSGQARINGVNPTTVATISAPLAGTGGMDKRGDGTLILTGTSTYTGGTTVTEGILQLGTGGTGGTGGTILGDIATVKSIYGYAADSTPIHSFGRLAFNRSDTVTYAGVNSGGGMVKQIGTGTTILTGTDTHTGGTTITAGTLQVGTGGTSDAITGDVAGGGALVFKRQDSLTYAGAISGTGTLEQTGSGTLVLTGASTLTGATRVSGSRAST